MSNLDVRRVLRRPLTYNELKARIAKLSGNKENPNAVTRWLDTNKGRWSKCEGVNGGVYWYNGWEQNLGDKKRPQDIFMHVQIALSLWANRTPETMTYESLGLSVEQLRKLANRFQKEYEHFLAIFEEMGMEPVEEQETYEETD